MSASIIFALDCPHPKVSRGDIHRVIDGDQWNCTGSRWPRYAMLIFNGVALKRLHRYEHFHSDDFEIRFSEGVPGAPGEWEDGPKKDCPKRGWHFDYDSLNAGQKAKFATNSGHDLPGYL